jgi:hydroxymethylglutaryl-CoA lyase
VRFRAPLHQSLLREIGFFDTIDFFELRVSQAISTMIDTAEILSKLDLSRNNQLLAIIANTRGAIDACQHSEIDYLGYPFFNFRKFQMRNPQNDCLW